MKLETLHRFPCSHDKTPLTRWRNATADVDDMEWPLVGVPTGSVNGFDCLDVDPGGMDWLDANRNRLPLTREHQTPRGRHLLFKHSDGLRNSVGRVSAGVDIRGDGGFICWWPRQGFEA